MLNCIIVGIGGFVGSVLRYLISLAPIFNRTTFPLSTLLVNILGSLIIGFVIGLSLEFDINQKTMVFLKIGVCGGFTTFSTFALEINDLFVSDNMLLGIIYICLSLVLGLAAIVCGKLLTTILI